MIFQILQFIVYETAIYSKPQKILLAFPSTNEVNQAVHISGVGELDPAYLGLEVISMIVLVLVSCCYCWRGATLQKQRMCHIRARWELGYIEASIMSSSAVCHSYASRSCMYGHT